MDGIHNTGFIMGSYSCLQKPGLVNRLISLACDQAELNTKIPKQLFSEHLKGCLVSVLGCLKLSRHQICQLTPFFS